MFRSELPVFYQNDSVSEYFVSNINDLFEIKNNDYFNAEALEGFINVTDDLENSLMSYVNVSRQKVDYFSKLKQGFEENNEELRNLNEQLAVAKVERRSFGKIVSNDEYNGEIITFNDNEGEN